MTMRASDELSKLGVAEEVQIAARGRDGELRQPVTVWVVPYGDSLYVRSVKGRSGAWYRAVQATHNGRIGAGGAEHDITFVDADHNINDDVDAAYRAKYHRYAGRILDSVLTAEARSTTIKLMPRATS
jgi:hypothetical protein